MIFELIICLLFIAATLYLIDVRVNRYVLMNKYKIVIDLFDHFLEESYDVIYNDQIIAYTANGHKIIPPDEMETIERNFIKMTFQIMGPKNEWIISSFYGDRDVVIQNMILFVRNKLNADALAKFVQEQEIKVNNQ